MRRTVFELCMMKKEEEEEEERRRRRKKDNKIEILKFVFSMCGVAELLGHF